MTNEGSQHTLMHLISGYRRDNNPKDHPAAYDLGELEQPYRYNLAHDSAYLHQRNRASIPGSMNLASTGTIPFIDTHKRSYQQSFELPIGQRIDGWGESHFVQNSPGTDISTDQEVDKELDAEDLEGAKFKAPERAADGILARNGDAKAQRRLAQNREAARKSRLRKKAYVMQLEKSRLRLIQLERELQQERQQVGHPVGGPFAGGNHSPNQGAIAFDSEYSWWLDEQNKKINNLRKAIHNHVRDDELKVLVDCVMNHHDEIFRLKNIAIKVDIFHILSGMWKTPVEQVFLWMGGHRPSTILKIIAPQAEPMMEQQSIFDLVLYSQQAEDALSKGMESLQNSLADAVSNGISSASSGPSDTASYLGQMAKAMENLPTFETLVQEADHLRQRTLHQLQIKLSTQQLAKALVAIHEYFWRLRALNSLWLARPRD